MKNQIKDAARPDCPEDERRDINREALRFYLDEIGRVDPNDVLEDINMVLSDPFAVSKAVVLEPYLRAVPYQRGNHKSVLYLNEHGVVDRSDAGWKSRWLEKPMNGFEFLRDIAYGVDLIAAVVMTRQRQVSAFLKPEKSHGPLGFHIVRADGEKMSEADKKAARRIERMLLDGGDEDNYFARKKLRRKDLYSYVSTLVRDTLIADACPVELTYTPSGKLSGWYNVDFTTVRLCIESGYEGDDEIVAVQVIDAVPHVAYTFRDLIYEVRNPRADLRCGGYGYSENEVAIRAITAYLNSIVFNASGIDRNATPRGFITLIGDYDQDQLTSFKRQMMLMLRGASNRWNVPIMSAKEGAAPVWTPMDSYNEMFFARWITLLASVVCAVYGIDPSEINLDSFSVRPSALSGDNTAQKLAQSRDKGLIPLLFFVEKHLNILVQAIDKKYMLEFVGLFEDDANQKQERLKIVATVDEMREIDGRPPFNDPVLGAAPVNPALQMLYQQRLQEQQQAGQGMQQQEQSGGVSPYGEEWHGVPQSYYDRYGAASEQPDEAAGQGPGESGQ